ncbi:MAG TPA: LamG domain-containing protein [Burkholderiales bacterium]|nr:LamG domain-containing protein [Burkholderiales bacterium]
MLAAIRKHLARIAVAALALLLLGSLALNVVIVQDLRVNAEPTPARSDFVAGKCSAPSLVGHWRFESLPDAVGDMAIDDSGYSNHARLEVARLPLSRLRYSPPAQAAGIDGRAVEVSGRQWLGAGNSDCFTTERFTVAVWIWLDEVGNVPTIVGKSAWPHNGWWLMTTTRGIQADDRYLDLGVAWPGGTAHVQSGYQVPLREWHHVVVTVDNLQREVQFFVDGKLVSRHTDVPRWHVNWDHELVIGDYDGSARWPWIGRIDDLRFYNHVLSEADCVALYRAEDIGLNTPPQKESRIQAIAPAS